MILPCWKLGRVFLHSSEDGRCATCWNLKPFDVFFWAEINWSNFGEWLSFLISACPWEEYQNRARKWCHILSPCCLNGCAVFMKVTIHPGALVQDTQHTALMLTLFGRIYKSHFDHQKVRVPVVIAGHGTRSCCNPTLAGTSRNENYWIILHAASIWLRTSCSPLLQNKVFQWSWSFQIWERRTLASFWQVWDLKQDIWQGWFCWFNFTTSVWTRITEMWFVRSVVLPSAGANVLLEAWADLEQTEWLISENLESWIHPSVWTFGWCLDWSKDMLGLALGYLICRFFFCHIVTCHLWI